MWAKGLGLLFLSPFLSPQLYHRPANILSLPPHDGQVSPVGKRVLPDSSSSTQLNPATPRSWAFWAEGSQLVWSPGHPLPTTAVEGLPGIAAVSHVRVCFCSLLGAMPQHPLWKPCGYMYVSKGCTK